MRRAEGGGSGGYRGFRAGGVQAPPAPSLAAARRERRAAMTTVAGFAGSGISLAITLASVPLTLHYLGPERYGVWVTLSSLVAIFAAVDLGIGNGLLNAVALASGRDDAPRSRHYVAGGIAVLMIASVVIGFVLVFGAASMDWAAIFNVRSGEAVREATPATVAIAIGVAFRIPLMSVASIRSALQEGYLNHAFGALGNGLTLIGVILCIAQQLDLVALAMAATIGPVVAMTANLALLFGRSHPELRPRWGDVEASVAFDLLRVGAAYFVLQAASSLAYLSDTFILARLIGPEAVAQYSVATKLFLIPATVALLAVVPLWPAYRDALARGEEWWIRRTLRRSIAVVFLVTVPTGAVIALISSVLVQWWVGPELTVATPLVIAAGLASMVLAVKNALVTVLNGLQVLRFQLATAVTMVILNLTLSVWLTSFVGVSGVLWGSIIATIAATIVPDVLYLSRSGLLLIPLARRRSIELVRTEPGENLW